jgi:hypothetical protein
MDDFFIQNLDEKKIGRFILMLDLHPRFGNLEEKKKKREV